MVENPEQAAQPSSNDLGGRIAVVTGASSGIGKAIALALAGAGADVLVHARASATGAEQTAQAIRALGRQSQVILHDLARQQNHEALVEQAWNWQGAVDIWVNNAGVDVLTGEAADWSFDKKLHHLWQVDVLATICLSRLVGSKMVNRQPPPQRAVILNMGWDQAELGMAGDSGQMFGAVKGAVMSFTRSLAQSLAPAVRVNCLAPGWIRTAWGEHASESWQQRAQKESLLGRWGTPEDVAQVARFLASPAADFITGQTVPINGGFRSGHVDC